MVGRQVLPILFVASMLLGRGPALASGPVVVDNSRSPHAQLRSVGLTEVTWTDGFWRDWFYTVRTKTLPHLHRLAVERGAVQNLEIAAGLKSGTYSGVGNDWMDAWVYKWIEAAATVYAVTGDTELDRQMDELIAVIAKAQEPDGYIASQNLVRKRARFQNPNHHEVYVMGHLLTAAVIHHRCTGKDSFLEVARRTGDFLHGRFRGKNPEMAHFPINPSVIMGAVELYRETGEPRYLELANTVIDMRGAFAGGSDLNQDRIPLRRETEVVGHAVFYTYLYGGAADACMETGDASLLTALTRLWQDLADHKLYITGGTCAVYRGISVRDGNIYAADIVHEAVGPRYFLPQTPAYNETCGQVGNCMWNWRMLALTGEARYADMMEREMYNGFLPGIGVDGRSFTYTNPLRWYGREQELWAQDSPERHQPAEPKPHQPKNCYGTCCPTNVLRILAQMQHYFYSIGQDGLWIHHYGGSVFDNGPYRVKQATDYPWEGRVEIAVEKAPRDAAIHLRIPAWAEGASVRVNGKTVTGPIRAGAYAAVRHAWRPGDMLTLTLPMDVRLTRAHSKVDAARNQIAVERGPLVYCLESCDLPEGVDISEIILPRVIRLKPQMEPNFLGGVVTLRGRALRLPRDDAHLYTTLSDHKPRPIDVKLIPYYAWKNRGVSQMAVWLPIDW